MLFGTASGIPLGLAAASEGLKSWSSAAGNVNCECLKNRFWLESAKQRLSSVSRRTEEFSSRAGGTRQNMDAVTAHIAEMYPKKDFRLGAWITGNEAPEELIV